jgi:hypothetical protein
MQGSLSPYTGQEQRDIALRAATAEYQKYVNERRLKEALRAKSSLAMNCLYQPGDNVLIYRERSRLWDGPYSVVVQDGKIVIVKLNDNTAEQRFNVSSVKLYRLPETPNTAIQKQDQKPSLQPSPSDLEYPAVEESRVYQVMVTEIISSGDRLGFPGEKQLPTFSDQSKSEGWRGLYSLSVHGRSERKEGFVR